MGEEKKAESTNEFSFIAKPGKHGVGVFAAHKIKEGTFLRLFGGEKGEKTAIGRKKEEVPKMFREYCVDRGETIICPRDFGQMPIGWYMNHSAVPNAVHRDYDYYAARDIAEGEEITIDYNTLEEPEEARKEYYNS